MFIPGRCASVAATAAQRQIASTAAPVYINGVEPTASDWDVVRYEMFRSAIREALRTW